MAEEQRSWQKALVVGSNISTSLAILVGGGFFLGRYLDVRWQTEPLFTISLMLIGLVLGGSYLVITLMKLGASDDKK
ncbi:MULTISPECIES: AtpZ/AtpI family protein [Desulfosporosinus]|uniref:Putative F0F1-ATPase subunit Ca2+/Mg2+ transporter n=1 Tax=Desulfosporosinus lacus DSM 15449 TaxID=1121420 RepID=A0A1M5R2M0_9FIRM|nr:MULTISPECIES: AtpZ/AtpI family protein [Desulfosporosinus]MCB8816243.1 AtpZ/AtpI family protein [Desulfosporosinus sp. SRJS8]SHH20637.1 Putative F0F1-ATPase subunit Ca2+/Mg2+ transporter [Desulfosporosinus lacus DSM 15449]